MKSSKTIWIGRIITTLVTLFFAFDAIFKLFKPKVVVDSMIKLGYPDVAVALGIILLISTILYAIPKTSVLGAILITGYLGGAVDANLRISAPLFTNILFPAYCGILLWLGLYLRDQRIRAILPTKTPQVNA